MGPTNQSNTGHGTLIGVRSASEYIDGLTAFAQNLSGQPASLATAPERRRSCRVLIASQDMPQTYIRESLFCKPT